MKRPGTEQPKAGKTQNRAPACPRDITTAEARRVWKDTVGKWQFETYQLAQLHLACQCLDEVARYSKTLKDEGPTVITKFGPRPNPIADLLAKARAGALRHTRALGLDLEPKHEGKGRPAGK